MKTTIDMSDSLFKRAREMAVRHETTFKEVVETALMFYLDHRREAPRKFKLKKGSFAGQGLVEGVNEGDWGEIRKRAYEGQGG